ncbi:hypothetical protein D9M71_282460 [compost metagenome]
MSKLITRIATFVAFAFISYFSFAQASEQAPIKVTVFLHDDLPAHVREGVHYNYLASWEVEMKTLTDRQIDIEYISQRPPYTSFPYQEVPKAELIKNWTDLTQNYRKQIASSIGSFKTNKYLLLTRNNINFETLGVANPGSTAAIASVNAYGTAAHELGHLFDATHEAAQLLYNGWVCSTFTYPTHTIFYSSCPRYSDANRAAIRNYLSTAP